MYILYRFQNKSKLSMTKQVLGADFRRRVNKGQLEETPQIIPDVKF